MTKLDELLDMTLHQQIKKEEFIIMRVPGGWIYFGYDDRYGSMSTFVPEPFALR